MFFFFAFFLGGFLLFLVGGLLIFEAAGVGPEA
jgi:hypothetical protein